MRSNHTLLSNSSHIIYDGLSSRDFGITNVQPADGLVEELFLPSSTLITDKSRYNDRIFLLGIDREPLEFSIRLLFDPYSFTERKLQEIKKWFYQDTYKPFRFDSAQEQDLDIWVYAIATGDSMATHNAINDGFVDFTFTTNAPYRFSQVMEDEYDFSVTTTQKMEREFNSSFEETTKVIEKLMSRLRQSVRNQDTITNRLPTEYRSIVNPLLIEARAARDHIDKPFNEMRKVEGISGTYRAQWLSQKTTLNNTIRDAEILWSRITALPQGYLNAKVNLYSKDMNTKGYRLHVNGDETVNNNYVTSDYFQQTNSSYTWSSNKTIGTPVIHFYDVGRNFISAEQLPEGQVISLNAFPMGTQYFRVSARINTNSDSHWKIETGNRTAFTESPYDLFPEIRESTIVENVRRLQVLLENLDSILENVIPYINNQSSRINNTLELYPDIVNLYNFGDLPVKPIMELEVMEPETIRIVNLDTDESTILTNNIKGEVITLLNETEQVRTSRQAPYFKYGDHDDNFITLREYENRLQFYGSFKLKITYQFKIL